MAGFETNYVDLPHSNSSEGRRFRNPKRWASQSNDSYTVVQHFAYRGISHRHKGAARHIMDMLLIWLGLVGYIARLSQWGGGGYNFTCSEDFLSVCAAPRGREDGVSILWLGPLSLTPLQKKKKHSLLTASFPQLPVPIWRTILLVQTIPVVFCIWP